MMRGATLPPFPADMDQPSIEVSVAIRFSLEGKVSPGSAADLRAEDAAHHVGETATVCGVVASAKFDAGLQSQPTFLDFGKPYPDQVFTAVVFGDDRTKFGTPEASLRGKRVCVSGKSNRNAACRKSLSAIRSS